MARASAVRGLRSGPSIPVSEPKVIVADAFYNESETAHFLRLETPKTLTIWRCRGSHPELKFTKPYGRVLYKGSDIIAFLSGAAKPPESPKRWKGTR